MTPTDRALRRRLDPLDTDLLAELEIRDRRLYAILSLAMTYRESVRSLVSRLRAGDDPAFIRPRLTKLDPLMKELRRIAGELG